jgi:hypothetical protein
METRVRNAAREPRLVAVRQTTRDATRLASLLSHHRRDRTGPVGPAPAAMEADARQEPWVCPTFYTRRSWA